MRKARFTFPGAFHHVMNRGIGGENIFVDNKVKNFFLNTLIEESMKQRIRILAYSIMDNHYHIVLQNIHNRMSDFMRQLNGNFGSYYRIRKGGKGYVFQGRYKSILIQEDSYLKVVIIYVLLNSVQAGIISDPYKFEWSSINEYYNGIISEIVDNQFVEELYGSEINMKKLLQEWSGKEMPVRRTKFGDIIGDDEFVKWLGEKLDRRKKKGESLRMRKHDYVFEPCDSVIKSFEEQKGIKIEEISTNCKKGKTLRSELLVLLRDKAGLRYKEIIRYPLFKSLKYSSLRQLYKRTKEKI